MQKDKPVLVGWREWIALPTLGIDQIKAKVDTGARTSTLHAFDVEQFTRHGKPYVHFNVHPVQDDIQHVISCTAEIYDQRTVTDSSGNQELRYIIKTALHMANTIQIIEMTLTNRDTMRFRMLLGRTALKQFNAIIDPAQSFLLGKQAKVKL